MQLQVVEPVLQWRDPTVEQILGRYQLAAEVVDDKTAAQCLHMERSLVVICRGVIFEIEHLQRQLATGVDKGPPAGDPARVIFLAPDEGERVVVARGGGTQQSMKAGVVDAHDLPLDDDRVRHVDHVGEYACKAERDGGFAVAGRTIEEYGPARVQRRSDMFDKAVIEDQ